MSSKFEPRLKREEHELPATVDGVVALVRQILMQGGVHRLIVDSSRPVRAYRAVEDALLEEEDVTLDGALRNATIIEYGNPGATPFEKVFDMFYVAQRQGTYPMGWAVSFDTVKMLAWWFGLEERGVATDVLPMTELLGLPIHYLKSLPPDALILFAAMTREADLVDVAFGIKATIEFWSRDRGKETNTSSTANSSVGNDPTGRNTSATALAAPARGNRIGGGLAQSLLGVRLGHR